MYNNQLTLASNFRRNVKLVFFKLVETITLSVPVLAVRCIDLLCINPLLLGGGGGGVAVTPSHFCFFSFNVFAFNTLKANLQSTSF